jgi:hypothetical protein
MRATPLCGCKKSRVTLGHDTAPFFLLQFLGVNNRCRIVDVKTAGFRRAGDHRISRIRRDANISREALEPILTDWLLPAWLVFRNADGLSASGEGLGPRLIAKLMHAPWSAEAVMGRKPLKRRKKQS